MSHSRITARLEYDIKHLIWRAGVHELTSEEICARFEQIKREYLSISTTEERGLLMKQFDEWEVVLADRAPQAMVAR
ncbi:hypothetical protein [Motiliproteus sp. SC1-56]|uniref:hypothetical protein n=1 Tax=Motiliproteus sp. SC1-56 TaxID=2799565 RepID=UPI001A903D5E|nr:hypothetical protein [Motiliproteus sp. SC1-56]